MNLTPKEIIQNTIKSCGTDTLKEFLNTITNEIDRREKGMKRELWGKFIEAFEEYTQKIEPITILLPNDETATFNRADAENLFADCGVIDATI